MLFRGKTESPRGSKIEGTRISGDFAQHKGKVPAPQTFFQRKQGVGRALHLDMDQAMPKIRRQAMQVRTPTPLDRIAILHPQHHATIIGLAQGIGGDRGKGIPGKSQRQRRAASLVTAREHLAMRSPRQPRAPARSLPTAKGNRRTNPPGRNNGRHSGMTHMFFLCSIPDRFAITGCN